MNQSKLDKIIGTSPGWEKQVKDSDGDKLINILDCQPYNKKKQGLVHDIAVRFGKGRVKVWGQEGQADSENKRQVRSEVRQIRRESYKENEIRFAKEKAKIDTDRRIANYKKGNREGFFNTLMTQTRQATTPRVIHTKSKHSKKHHKTTKRVGKTLQTRPRNTDFTSGNIFV